MARWLGDDPPLVRDEHGAPPAWARGLRARGYQTIESPPGDQSFGHAQAIGVAGDGLLAAAADPRAGDGGVAGLPTGLRLACYRAELVHFDRQRADLGRVRPPPRGGHQPGLEQV